MCTGEHCTCTHMEKDESHIGKVKMDHNKTWYDGTYSTTRRNDNECEKCSFEIVRERQREVQREAQRVRGVKPVQEGNIMTLEHMEECYREEGNACE